MEVGKVCKKMHKHVFDGENIDLRQVIKDVYDNFTLIFKATISQLEHLDRKFGVYYYEDESFELRKRLGLLITFSRCILSWYVEKGTGVINRSLIDILTDVESHFVNLLEFCTTLVSRKKLGNIGKSDLRYMTRFVDMESRVSNAYLAVLHMESSSAFIHSDESMVEFLDQVLEDLNQCDVEDKDIKVSIEKLQLLRNYLQLTKEYWMRDEGSEEFLVWVEVVAESAACFSFHMAKHNKFAFWVKYMPRVQYRQIQDRLKSNMGTVGVLKALLMKLQDSTDLPPLTDGFLKGYVGLVLESFQHLMNDEAIYLTKEVENQMKCLCKELKYLVGLLLSWPPKHESELEKLSDIRAQFMTLVLNVVSVLFLFLKEEATGDVAIEMCNLGISDFLEKAHFLKGRITDIFFLMTFGRVGRNSPQTHQLGFLNFQIHNLRELKDSRFDGTTYEAGGFQTIYDDLVLLRSFFQNITMDNGSTTADDDEGSKELLKYRIRCAAYEAEHFINSYLARAIPDSSSRSCWLSDFKRQVKLIEATIADISEKRSANDHIDHNIDIYDVGSSKNPRHVQPLALAPSADVVVGFEDEMELIKERLTSDLRRKLDIVSIVGMGGLGKTTFAKRVYEDPSIIDHFQIRAWCCVSQDYDKKQLLLTILACITKLTADAYTMKSYSELSVMLHKQLTGSRYLIVMDDIWGIDALKDLKRFFPDNSNGSRLMLTSRNRLEEYSDPIELCLLTHEKSWELLKQKVYHKDEECPLHLRQVGEKIAENCRGLPLAIVVVGGILAKSEKNRDFWEKVAANLSLYIAGDTTHGQVLAALELSYDLLPEHLKPLFLYLGAFPEDTEIPANKLTWLWIAEGLVQKTDQFTISLEVQAELHLMDLIDRSLVMITERRSDGRVKSCRFHDLLRDMCLRKAKQENFMEQINVHDDLRDPVTYERRISIFLSKRYYDTPTSPGPFVTCEGLPNVTIPPPLSSFLFFNTNKTLPLPEEDVKLVFRDWRLLRILDSESITVNANTYEDHVRRMFHLRYILIRIAFPYIPSSISDLGNLETLIITGLGGEMYVPRNIWLLVKLRHLHINYSANFSGALLCQSSSKLENLQTLSTPVVCCGEEKKLIRRVPNLRKLRFISIEAKNSSGNFEYHLPQLESLDQLESLKILCKSRMRCISGQFGLPLMLKKLTLSKFRLQWSEISSFGRKLPNLEVLKLRGGTFEGALWDLEDVEFSKLKFLKLESLNIEKWIVYADNFPCLKKLVLQSCKKLVEIPSSIGDFYSLEKIDVLWCSTSAAYSAKQILEEQRDNGNELLKVQIHMSRS